MWSRRSHVLAPLIEVTIGPKGRAIIWNNDLELSLLEFKCVVSAETLLNYPGWEIIFTVHIDAYDKQLGVVISQNDKPIAFFLRKFI